ADLRAGFHLGRGLARRGAGGRAHCRIPLLGPVRGSAAQEVVRTIRVPRYSLGIDIGGTFTDIVVYDHDSGRQWSRKILTTHDDPARAVATAWPRFSVRGGSSRGISGAWSTPPRSSPTRRS